MQRTNHPPTTAAESYAARLTESQDLLARIGSALAAHQRRQAQSSGDWGYAGEFGGVTERLAYVLAMLGDRSGVDAKGLGY